MTAPGLSTPNVSSSPPRPKSKVPAYFRPTWAEISTGHFATNVRALKSLVGATVKLMAVLKADAYGHGAAALAPVAMDSGADIIGVSSLEEGIALRDRTIKAPILILGGVYPFENLAVAVHY